MKVGLIRTPNLTSIFWKTIIDRAKRFSPMKTTFQDEQGDFRRILRIKSCRKIKTKFITVRKMVSLWFHSSVATLEAYKSESGVDANCYKYKRNTIGVILEWILTTRTAATTPRISIFTLSLLKIRPAFFNVPQCLLAYFSKMKKDIDKRFPPL